MQWFVLIEDWEGDGTLGRKCDSAGDALDPESPAVSLYSGADGRPAGAREGYYGLWIRDAGKWRFVTSTCPDTSCDVGDSSISVGTPPDLYVNESYTHTINWEELEGDPVVDGLPDGLLFNPVTGIINGMVVNDVAVVTEYTVTVSGTSAENGCPIVEAFVLRVNPCRVVDAYIDLDNPPNATVDVAYSHTILFDDLTITGWGGLPPGFALDPGTGALTGTCDEEGAWSVWVEGLTVPNGCTIRKEFVIKVLPCDADGSKLYVDGGSDFFLSDLPFQMQVVGFKVTGNIELHKVEECCPSNTFPFVCSPSATSLPAGISYAPTTGILSGTANDPVNDCLPYPCHYLLTFRALSEENECWVYTEVRLYFPCPCPEPDDYTALAAWLVDSGSATSNQTFHGPDSETLTASNAIFTSKSGTNQFGYSGWGTGLLEVDVSGSVPPGTYIVVFFGRVTSGPYTDCPIIHTRTYTVS